MRTVTRLLAIVGLAVTVGSTAGADVSVSLVQIGGTYNAGVGAIAGDTLVLAIDYAITDGPNYTGVTLVDPSLLVDGSVNTAVVFTGLETGSASFFDPTTIYGVNPPAAFAPLSAGIGVAFVTDAFGTWANGWEKGTTLTTGVIQGAGCTSVAGNIFCTRLGNVTFTLTGLGGTIQTGAQLASGNATVIGGPGFANVTVNPGTTLGSFTIVPIPEPTTASLLGLGLVGLTVAGRRRKS